MENVLRIAFAGMAKISASTPTGLSDVCKL